MKNHISMILMVVIAISSLAIAPSPTLAGIEVPNSCNEFPRRTKKLCTKFCEKLDCDSEIPQDQILRRLVCRFIEHIFIIKTGIEPPCEIDPCAELAAIAECPCDYDSVPKTTACWGDCTNCTDDPDFLISAGPIPVCFMIQPTTQGSNQFMNVGEDNPSDPGAINCRRENFNSTSCTLAGQSVTGITPAQTATCQCRLEQYANELSQVDGITLNTDGPPFSCTPP